MENHTMKFFVYLLLVIGLLGSGCRSIGPNKVTHDRFAYSQSLAYSWKSQMLLNIVKIRYLDLPVFLDVGQLVTGYSLETSVDVGGNFFSGGGFGSVGGQGRYTDRPTITYKPLTGDRFLEGFLTPIPPVNVFSLLQSGYAADLLLELCLDSFNGLYNRPALLASEREPDPEFFQVLSLMHEVQDAGAFGMKIEEATEEQSALVLFFRDEKATDDILMKLGKIRSLLDVAPDQVQFELVYSPLPGGPGKLAVPAPCGRSCRQCPWASPYRKPTDSASWLRLSRRPGRMNPRFCGYTAVRTNQRIVTSLYLTRTSGSGLRMMTGNQNVSLALYYFSLHSRMQVVQKICQSSPSRPINRQMLSIHTI
jgi:hypothetical protein